jgi:hypothetical protein
MENVLEAERREILNVFKNNDQIKGNISKTNTQQTNRKLSWVVKALITIEISFIVSATIEHEII